MIREQGLYSLMKELTYVIIDDQLATISRLKELCEDFQELNLIGEATSFQEGLDLVLEFRPNIVFLSIEPQAIESGLSLHFISALYRYLLIIPKIIVVATSKDFAYEAIQFQVSGYLLRPIQMNEFRRAVLSVSKEFVDQHLESKSVSVQNESAVATFTPNLVSEPNKSLLICVKSYGDYRYLHAHEILYFQADNNSTDIYLQSGEVITAFKTLKHFESVLQEPFYRIHNSFIVNCNSISRIHTGSKLCTLRNTPKKIPFSKSYKSNIELIISRFSNDNYLEV